MEINVGKTQRNFDGSDGMMRKLKPSKHRTKVRLYDDDIEELLYDESVEYDDGCDIDDYDTPVDND